MNHFVSLRKKLKGECMKDIVLVLSDQHSGCITSSYNSIIQTPCLDAINEEAQVFTNAYCNNPLCVPSRMSFLSGKEPHELGIYNNDQILDSEEETLASKLKGAGYRTVLVGRMHFKGHDQYHGFEERYVGDITTQWWNQKRNDLGAFQGTMQMNGCLKEFGYGPSPVQSFDEAVLKKSLEILEEKEDRPLFLVIGFYGPHFPYCVEKKYFDHYFDKIVDTNNYFDTSDECYQDMQMDASESTLKYVRSSYYGLIEKLDNMIGEIYKHCKNKIFIYTSDHGDQLGKRKLFGKKTMYDESIMIPLTIVDKSKLAHVFTHEVSLLNLHQTILAYADIEHDTTVFEEQKPIRITSMIGNENPQLIQAIIFQGYKLIKYNNCLKLVYLDSEVKEDFDRIKIMRKYFVDEKDVFEKYTIKQNEVIKNRKWTNDNNPQDWIRYHIHSECTKKPKRREGYEI